MNQSDITIDIHDSKDIPTITLPEYFSPGRKISIQTLTIQKYNLEFGYGGLFRKNRRNVCSISKKHNNNARLYF